MARTASTARDGGRSIVAAQHAELRMGIHLDAGGSPAIDSVCCLEPSVWLLAA